MWTASIKDLDGPDVLGLICWFQKYRYVWVKCCILSKGQNWSKISLLLLPSLPLSQIALPLPGSTLYGYWKHWKFSELPSLRKFARFWMFIEFIPFLVVPNVYNYWLFGVYKNALKKPVYGRPIWVHNVTQAHKLVCMYAIFLHAQTLVSAKLFQS